MLNSWLFFLRYAVKLSAPFSIDVWLFYFFLGSSFASTLFVAGRFVWFFPCLWAAGYVCFARIDYGYLLICNRLNYFHVLHIGRMSYSRRPFYLPHFGRAISTSENIVRLIVGDRPASPVCPCRQWKSFSKRMAVEVLA